MCAPDHGPDAGEKFAGVKRFGVVVVRTHLQSNDSVGLRAHGGQRDDRDAGRFMQVAVERKSVLAGHHDVNNGGG